MIFLTPKGQGRPIPQGNPTHGLRIAGNYHYECYCGHFEKDKEKMNEHLRKNPGVSISVSLG